MNSSLAEAMIQAASLQIRGRLEDALAELCRAREAGHHSPKLNCAVGHLQFELRQFQAAAGTYADIVKLDGSDPTACYNLAVCLEKLGAWEQAAAAFSKVVEIDPRNAGAQLGLGICLLNQQRTQDALDALERCLERQPFRESALRGRALALHLLQRYEEALACYQKLLVHNPHSEELLANAIASAIARGEYDLMTHFAQRLLGIRPGSVANSQQALRKVRHE